MIWPEIPPPGFKSYQEPAWSFRLYVVAMMAIGIGGPIALIATVLCRS